MAMSNMREEKKSNLYGKLIVLTILLGEFFSIKAQDLQSSPSLVSSPLTLIPEYIQYNSLDIKPIDINQSMPATFRNTQENKLIRQEELFPFFECLINNNQPVRVLHIGDSHVRGHIFTTTTRQRLEQAWGKEAVIPDTITYQTSALAIETGQPGIVYHTLGINGATTVHFCSPDKLGILDSLRPNLIIISFGTNESHARSYTETNHLTELNNLLYAFRHHCPNAKLLLTTPPGSYIRKRQRQRVINQRTNQVANTILAFAKQHELPVWDLYHIVGGSQQACQNWTSHKYMQRDKIHYTHAGYCLQGNLLAEAILKAFNEYVEYRFKQNS